MKRLSLFVVAAGILPMLFACEHARGDSSSFTIASPAQNTTVSTTINIQLATGSEWVNAACFQGSTMLCPNVTPSGGTATLSFNPAQLKNGSQTLDVAVFNVPAGTPCSPGSSCRSDINLTLNIDNCSGNYCIGIGPFPGDLNITSSPYNCAGDGTTDDTTCLQDAINDAHTAGVGVYVPAGTFNYSQVLTNPGVRIDGAGYAQSILQSTVTSATAIQLKGANAIIANLQMITKASSTRQNNSLIASAISPQSSAWQVDHVLINGNFTAGIFAYGASGGKVTNTTVENTLADCIGFYHGSYGNLADSNYIYACGDDGISNVSYSSDSTTVNSNTISNNVVENNKNGRGETVVGGTNITFTNNYIWGNQAGNPCLEFAADGSAKTQSTSNVTWNGGEFGGNCITTYPGALFIASSSSGNVSNVTVENFIAKPSGGVGFNITNTCCGGGTVGQISLINYTETGESSNSIESGAVVENTTCQSGCGYTPTPVGAAGTVITPQ